MTPSFFIAKSFVSNISFDANDSEQFSPFSVSHLETNLHVDVEVSNSQDTCHFVETFVNITSTTKEKEHVYDLSLIYAAVVGTPDGNISESDLNEILKVRVPQALLDNIRSLVYQVTRDAGFPFMMRDDTFDNPIQNEDEPSKSTYNDRIDEFFDALSQDTFDLPQLERIDFQWLISFSWADDDDELLESIHDFWNTYSSQFGDGVITDYEDLPIYKCYYRFFTPIDYCHSDFEECDESIWPILFQMLYGSLKSQCRVIDAEQGLPEIEFSYESFHDRTISSLTLEELKELLSDLFTESLTDMSVKLLEYRNESVFSGEPFQSNQLMSEQDFYRIFDANVSDENVSFLGMMYEKIKECNLQTLLYQS